MKVFKKQSECGLTKKEKTFFWEEGASVLTFETILVSAKPFAVAVFSNKKANMFESLFSLELNLRARTIKTFEKNFEGGMLMFFLSTSKMMKKIQEE